jgi:crossover junction endodeoxyribonuclease RuvC
VVKILGIDPGSRITGYGIIDVVGNHHRYLASGCIRLQQPCLSERLAAIFQAITGLMVEWQPEEAAIEEVFVHHNVQGALKLGQARGAAIVAMAHYGLAVAEYSAREIKQSVVGYGAADKVQVQHMVKILLNLTSTPSADAADALAVALSHAQQRRWQQTLKTAVVSL